MPSRPFTLRCLALLLPVVLLTARLAAAPVSQAQALDAAYAWVNLSPRVMDERHGHLAGTVTIVRDALGEPEFYAVDLAPAGYVIVAADDTVEPIIAFSTTDTFDPVPGHPLYDMLRDDLPGRLSRARARRAAPAARWQLLRGISGAPMVLRPQAAVYTGTGAGGPSVSSVSEVRVSPLVKSKWNQQTSFGQPVYNYYTPPYSAGNPDNYLAGCVATMLSQLMRFHQWPQSGVGTASYQITVRKAGQQRALRGGDGQGGPYDWADMPLVATPDMPANQQQAIGALLVDAGVASNMDYEPGGSGAVLKASVLTNVFHYAGAAFSSGTLSNLEIAIDANLDAGLPVGLGISGGGVGHAVVADGYGYNGKTLYHHLNMGWSGAANAWYNLPEIVAGGYDFTVVNSALFNIDPTVKGEIVSGRITDGAGNPVAGAQVTMASGSVSITATTNAAGIYAAKGLASNSTWTITPSADGWGFTPAKLSVTTGHSSANGGMGDKTGEDFSSQRLTGSVTVQINPSAAAAGAQWRVDGGAWQTSGATAANVPVGTGAITFRAIADWATPASQQVDVITNQTASAAATYTPAYSLTAIPDNPLDGQVAANPAPGDMGSYAPGTSVTLTATPATGYYFSGWIESGTLASTDADYTSVVNGRRTLVANFPPNSLTGQNTQQYVTSNRVADTINVLAALDDTGGTPVILSVTQPANGTVTINGDGTLTFTPNAKFRGSTQFSYTAGDGNGGAITREVTIANWFAASAGTYAGLSLAGEVTNETSGYIKVTITSSGAFTGKLAVAGIAYALSGAFDGNANYQKVIVRKGASNLNVALHLVAASEITGSIGDGVTLSDISANRVTFSAANKAPQAGKYTALLSANQATPGNGYMVVSISPTGGVRATGRLADGEPVSISACLNADGSVPWYAGIYTTGAGAGSVLGTMTFQPNSSVACTGTYAWFRPPLTGFYYQAGFAESGSVTGSLLPGRDRFSRAGKFLATQPQHPGLLRRIARDDQRSRAIDARRRCFNQRSRLGQSGARRWRVGTGEGIVYRSGDREEAHGIGSMAAEPEARRRVLPGRRLAGRADAFGAVGGGDPYREVKDAVRGWEI